MKRIESKHKVQDRELDRLRAELSALDPTQKHRRIKPSYPGPVDPQPSFWHKYPPVMWLLPLFPPFLALFASPDVLDRWPLLAQFCRDMVLWFPFLGGHAKFSSMPQVITLVKCVSLALLLPATLLTFFTFWPRRHAYGAARIRAGRIPPPRYEELGLALIAGVFLFSNWVLTGDPSWCRGCTTNSRVGLAIREWAGVFAVPSFLVGIVVNLYVRLDVAFGTLIEGDKKK